MSATPEACAHALKDASVGIDAELQRILKVETSGDLARLYGMLRYFMGFTDADFKETNEASGKRFRPSLALLIAAAYGAKEKTLDAAAAIELFHNFTLIHDDVEDHDEFRRNRPTVWKLWGINHAINSGDAQSLLAAKLALRAGATAQAPLLSGALLDAFIEVIEGQYLDFELADAPLDMPVVSEAGYLRMIGKKSGVLVRAAAEAAGIAAGKDEAERVLLREYGMCLGTAYQMADDYRSVWTTQTQTGKDTHSDVREHKRTLPFIAAYAALSGAPKSRLAELYSLPRQLTEAEIMEACSILNMTDAKASVRAMIREQSSRAAAAATALSVPAETRDILRGIIELLVPEGGSQDTALLGEHAAIALA
jgi:geranylgeranyl diphosphate synthase type I